MTAWAAPAPEGLVYIVGDVHGCVDHLAVLLDRIDTDIARSDTPAQVVFVGDYIDRGPDSADVVRFVFEMAQDFPEMVVTLAGNHEQMLLDFLADPSGKSGRRWLRHGGLQTLASFGVGKGVTGDSVSAALLFDAAGDLQEAMGADMVNWLRSLPTSWKSGTLWVVHAAADPSLSMEAQSDTVLKWGHGAFLSEERLDGQWVAFGHQPFEAPFFADGKIGVDTGAVYGGQLTAARVDPEGEVTFLDTA